MRNLFRLFQEFRKFQKERSSNKEFLEFQEFRKFQKEKCTDENYKTFIGLIYPKRLLKEEVLGDAESLVSQKLLNSAELSQAISGGEFFLKNTATLIKEVDNSVMRKMLINPSITAYQGYALGLEVYRNALETLTIEEEIRQTKKN